MQSSSLTHLLGHMRRLSQRYPVPVRFRVVHDHLRVMSVEMACVMMTLVMYVSSMMRSTSTHSSAMMLLPRVTSNHRLILHRSPIVSVRVGVTIGAGIVDESSSLAMHFLSSRLLLL